MAEVAVHDDVVEEILLRLDAKDLNRYKRVCKSWRSLITSPGFVSRHLNLSYNKDHYNNQLAHRKVSLLKIHVSANYYHLKLVGSSNGLVCIFSVSAFGYKLVVGNPLTRENNAPLSSAIIYHVGGFGYDLSKDDYKVIVGEPTDMNQTCFWILSLKTNAWRFIGDYKNVGFLNDSAGILCNGALHWIMMDNKNDKKVIICYDLSKEEFKEILIPEGASHIHGKLGILKECLCLIFGYPFDDSVWVMKKYNVNESWERVKISHDREMRHDIVHWLRLGLSKDEDASWFYRASEHLCWEYMDAPVFVESLVSPHDNARGLPRYYFFALFFIIIHLSFLYVFQDQMPWFDAGEANTKIKSETEHVPEVVKESEAVEEVKIEKSESDHNRVQEVANESEIDQAVSVLTERKDLEAPELVKSSIEQIQEAVEVSIEKEDLGGPQLEKQSIEHTHEGVEKSNSILTEKDLGTPELEENLKEQIKEVMKEPDTVLTKKRILVDPTWERNHTSPWFKKMKPGQ
ncbi:F-box protein At3g07870-like [Bidens hawaiensis]|uniref:F-box protein At3g07870-like n=1 Tax=Bidens hawaiensis TaxID=980011 RepID=UPI00404A8F9F